MHRQEHSDTVVSLTVGQCSGESTAYLTGTAPRAGYAPPASGNKATGGEPQSHKMVLSNLWYLAVSECT